LEWGEFAWWFVIVVPLTSCTVCFWVAANKNMEQLGQGPLIFHESWGIWGAPLIFGLATGACLWALYADTESMAPVVVLAMLLLLVLLIATALLTRPQGSSAVWLGVSFAGVTVSAVTSLSLVTHTSY